jgi:hypothetical protein
MIMKRIVVLLLVSGSEPACRADPTGGSAWLYRHDEQGSTGSTAGAIFFALPATLKSMGRHGA